MAKFDRSAYKATKLETINETEKEAEKNSKRFGSKGSTWVGFHKKPEDGKNVYRVMPAHTPEGRAYVPFRSTWLEVMSDVYEDGKKVEGKQELRKRQIFIATQHSKIAGELYLADPVEFFIKKAYEMAEEIQDDKERAKFLTPIKGNFQAKPMVPGIEPNTVYVCYALDQAGELGKLSLNNKWFQDMKKISLEESIDSGISIDIFSNPDEGFPVVINKGKAKGKDGKERVEYKVSKLDLARTETWDQYFEKHRISDSDLEKMSEQTSLEELYYDSYTRRDLQLAVEGLKNFEQKNPKFNIVNTREFEDMVEKLYEVLPEQKQRGSSDDNDVEDKPVKKDVASNSVQYVTDVPPIKMKMHLRNYIAEKGYDKQLPDIKGDVLIEWYNCALQMEELPFEVEDETPSDESGDGRLSFLNEYISENYGSDYSLPSLNEDQIEGWYKLAQEGEELPFESVNEAKESPKTEKIADKQVTVTETKGLSIAERLAAKMAAKNK